MGRAGRVALIGGASSGIGLAVSRRFLLDGMHVVGLDLRPPVTAPSGTPGTFRFVECDVTSEAALASAIVVANERGPVWAVVNCATYVPPHVAFEDLPLTEWQRCFDVSVTGIVNFGSGESERPMAGQGAYAPAKGAIRSLTRILATEWGKYGITVNTVVPVALTPAYERWKAENPEEELRRLQQTPLRRLGDPERDVAPLVSFLVSEEASWITGATLAANGGRVMI
jgi:NAD(P)-dependent dehydrogenase (short-subunit alcohol dehydrogenase family)